MPEARAEPATDDYFCRSCSEHGRYCQNPLVVDSGGARCPEMSLLEFARLEGNLYTREFSGASACAPCAYPQLDGTLLRISGYDRVRQYPEACAEAAADHSGEDRPGVRAQRLQRAKENLQRSVFPCALRLPCPLGPLPIHPCCPHSPPPVPRAPLPPLSLCSLPRSPL